MLCVLTSLLFSEQISRLTWFTRFDPVEPVQHVFTVEQSSKGSQVTTGQMDNLEASGNEQETSNGKARHDRKGVSQSVSVLLVTTLLTILFFLLVSVSTEKIKISFFNTHTDSSSSASTRVHSQSKLMSALYWLCGMERKTEGENNHLTPPAPQLATCTLKEKRRVRHIVNINLLICLSVVAFFVGYWA